jgi:hypothetical protein
MLTTHQKCSVAGASLVQIAREGDYGGQWRNERAEKKVKNENAPFARNLVIKTIRDGGSGGGWLLDNTKEVETRIAPISIGV